MQTAGNRHDVPHNKQNLEVFLAWKSTYSVNEWLDLLVHGIRRQCRQAEGHCMAWFCLSSEVKTRQEQMQSSSCLTNVVSLHEFGLQWWKAFQPQYMQHSQCIPTSAENWYMVHRFFCEKSAKLITHSHSRINILSSLFFTISRYASVVDAADCSHFVCPFVSHTYAWCWND